ncbi:unnamed protein product [Gongylonema pulchrum]|uniref:RNASEK-C17orf49 readthrough (Non-protein coding) n=1 Tax=Gongylonema pulchrum TaxID=637853 RepID=A0A183D2C7_9BILA|nr:unnamed protein product [Gongylonema pulchrum]
MSVENCWYFLVVKSRELSFTAFCVKAVTLAVKNHSLLKHLATERIKVAKLKQKLLHQGLLSQTLDTSSLLQLTSQNLESSETKENKFLATNNFCNLKISESDSVDKRAEDYDVVADTEMDFRKIVDGDCKIGNRNFDKPVTTVPSRTKNSPDENIKLVIIDEVCVLWA